MSRARRMPVALLLAVVIAGCGGAQPVTLSAALLGPSTGAPKYGCLNAAPAGRMAHRNFMPSTPLSVAVPEEEARSGTLADHSWSPNARQLACSVARPSSPRTVTSAGASARPDCASTQVSTGAGSATAARTRSRPSALAT